MRIKIPIDIVELELNNYHPIVSCTFSDGSIGKWVIDTGASKTVFDKNLSGKFFDNQQETEELHSAGVNQQPIETTTGYLKSFLLGKLKVDNLKVALLDLSHINKLYSKTTDLEICGLLGSDFLMRYKAVVDYKKSKLILIK